MATCSLQSAVCVEEGICRVGRWPIRAGEIFRGDPSCGETGTLNRYDAVNAISPEDAELAFVVTAKVDETAATLAGAG